MRSIARALFAVVALMLLALPASAHVAEIHGTVLAVQPREHKVIVRYDSFAGKPSKTLTFRVSDARTLAKLRAGNGITATVDVDAKPWTLSNVRVIGDQAPTGTSMYRTSKRLKLGDALPATAFIDQAGRPFTFAQLQGRYVVLAFIYTRCRDARQCPLISANLAQLQNKVGPETKLVEVTLDPDYDRPPILRAYARTFGFRPDRVTLLTGDPNTVLDFAAMFGLSAFADPDVGLIHNENTVIVDPQGKIGEMITENSWTPDEVASIISHYQNRPSNPLARLDLMLSQAAIAVCGNGVAGFSGLFDLAVFLAILGAFGWLLFRVARGIARGST